MVQGQGGNGQGEDVSLNQRRREQGPGVGERQLGNECQVGDEDVGVAVPLAIADGGAEGGLEDEGDEEDAGDGRDVYSRRHGKTARARREGDEGEGRRLLPLPLLLASCLREFCSFHEEAIRKHPARGHMHERS